MWRSAFHAKSAETIAGRGIVQQGDECVDTRPIDASLRRDEVVLLVLDWNESQTCAARDRVERHAPVGAMLHDRGGDGVVIARLHRVARRLLATEQPIDQRARAT